MPSATLTPKITCATAGEIDIETADLRPVQSVAMARFGKRISPPTVHRWIRGKGVSGVRLEAVLCAGVWMTTTEAFARFLVRQTEARIPDPKPVTQPAGQDRSANTARRLERAGLLTPQKSAGQ